MVTLIDYGVGNLASLVNMFRRIGEQVRLGSTPEHILLADKLVLPGVGAFDPAIKRLNAVSGLREALDDKVIRRGTPILGICLGMQMLTSGSEEGSLPGLAWIEGETHRFNNANFPTLKVPHMGWDIALPLAPSKLTMDLPPRPRFYFVHSYYVKVKDPSDSLMRSVYGLEFDSAIGRDNIFGVQFHPEKSHKFGMKVLENFFVL